MWFEVLGPVRARVGGRELPAGSGRERLVLAVLSLDVGRVVGGQRLIDAVWDGAPPPTAKAQLHNAISALRRRIGPGADDVLRTRPAGYELRLDGHGFDLAEFRVLLERARSAAGDSDHAQAVEVLDRALALWRGRALADVTGDWAVTARRALDDERLAATELRLRSLLTLGREDEVLTALPPLVAENPYREHLYEMRMFALAARGRRAEALEVYQQAYHRLVEDLGVEPGPSLVASQRHILTGGRPERTTVSRLTPRQLPPMSWRPVGRERLAAEVIAALPSTPVAVLAGPGGIGKTTVALAIAHELAARYPDGQLHADLRGSRSTPADPFGVMARWLRALGAGDDLPVDPGPLTALYREHLAQRRVLLVLDDAATEDQVRPLLPGSAGCGVLVTSRRRFGDLPGTRRWSVPQLSDADALTLFAAVVGPGRVEDEPDAAAALVTACGNLPLAVAISAARLSTRPQWTLAGFAERLRAERGRLDELAVEDMDVRATIALSYQALDPEARSLFRRLGVLAAADHPAWLVDQLADGRPEPVDQLVDVHLLDQPGTDALGQRRFRMHDLVNDFARERAVAEDAADERLAVRTRLLNSWLGLAGEADDLIDHGMLSGAGVAVPPAPADVLPFVRRSPSTWMEIERRALVAAVGESAELGLSDVAGRLALRLVGYLGLRGHRDRERVLWTATAAVREHRPDEHGADELHGRLLTALIASVAEHDHFEDMAELLAEQRAVAARTGDRALEVRSLSQAGMIARRTGRLADAVRHMREALDTCTDDVPLQFRTSALAGLAATYVELGTPRDGIPFAEQAVALERAGGNARIAALHSLTFGSALLDAGLVDEAEREFDVALRTSTESGDGLVGAFSTFRLGCVDLHRCRLTGAEEKLRQALEEFDTAGDTATTAEIHRNLADLAVRQHDPQTAVKHLDLALAVWQGTDARLEAARTHARLDLVLTAMADHTRASHHRDHWQTTLRDLALPASALRLPEFLTAPTRD